VLAGERKEHLFLTNGEIFCRGSEGAGGEEREHFRG